MLLGDHGYSLGEADHWCKDTNFELDTHVPLIIRIPGMNQPGTATDALADFPGRDLQPLFQGATTEWRTHLLAEFHTHAAANFSPQRSVRTDRYKLIECLLPDEVNPGYADTFRKLETDAVARGHHGFVGGLQRQVAAASLQIRAAYAIMERPPQYELYDLQADRFELQNLTESPEHAEALSELKQQLSAWRMQTRDPLLDADNLQRLKTEVTAIKKREAKGHASDYPNCFFDDKATVR